MKARCLNCGYVWRTKAKRSLCPMCYSRNMDLRYSIEDDVLNRLDRIERALAKVLKLLAEEEGVKRS